MDSSTYCRVDLKSSCTLQHYTPVQKRSFRILDMDSNTHCRTTQESSHAVKYNPKLCIWFGDMDSNTYCRATVTHESSSYKIQSKIAQSDFGHGSKHLLQSRSEELKRCRTYKKAFSDFGHGFKHLLRVHSRELKNCKMQSTRMHSGLGHGFKHLRQSHSGELMHCNI